MTDFNFEVPKIEIIKGSEPGSVFIIIAKSSDLTLGIRMFLQKAEFDETATQFVSITTRLRVTSTSGKNVSIADAQQAFGNFGFYKPKGLHCSSVVAFPLVRAPCFITHVREAYLSIADFEKMLLNELVGKFHKSVKLCVQEELLIEILKEKIQDILPDVKIFSPDEKKFIWTK